MHYLKLWDGEAIEYPDDDVAFHIEDGVLWATHDPNPHTDDEGNTVIPKDEGWGRGFPLHRVSEFGYFEA